MSPSGLSDGLAAVVERLTDAVGASAAAVVTRTGKAGSRILANSRFAEDEAASLDEHAGDLVERANAGETGDPVAVPVPGALGDVALVVAGHDHGDLLNAAALRAAAERVGAAIEVARLRSDLDRAMAQILETDERLLGRIGLDIHDGPTQHLSVALLEIQLLEADLADAASNGVELPDGLLGSMERIYETLGGALTEMRELIGHLRPAQFENRRLSEILQDALTAFEARSGTPVQAEMSGEFPVNGVSVTQRITFYRVLQEALNNAHRHGHARHIGVRASDEDGGTRLVVADDGRGFDAEAALKPRSGAPIARFGLHGMRDRTNMLGGTFTVTSAPGEGCTIEVFLPTWRPEDDPSRA
ncbi:MAG: sensor histidine kinase [Thermoleophilia bacterium]|nr:sensor histidine kinase [Thermoleophilia bacterium]